MVIVPVYVWAVVNAEGTSDTAKTSGVPDDPVVPPEGVIASQEALVDVEMPTAPPALVTFRFCAAGAAAPS
jgi:hypothetical protein